jgi:hypothetical protein
MKVLSKNFSMIAGVLYLGVEALGGLIVIPLMYRRLPVDEVSAWILFLAFLPMAPLVVSGFGQITTREISGFRAQEKLNAVFRMVKLSRKLVVFASVYFSLVLIVLTAWFFKNGDIKNHIVAWGFFCVGIYARISLFRSFSIYLGFGFLGIDKLIMCLTSALMFISAIASVFLGGGVLVLCICYATISIASSFIAFRLEQKISKVQQPVVDSDEIPNVLIKKSEIFKMYLINLGGFFTLNTDIFVAKHFFKAEVFVEYSLLSRIMLASIAIVSMYVALNFPALAKIAKTDLSQNLHKEVLRITKQAICFSLMLACLVLIAYDQAIFFMLKHHSNISFIVVVAAMSFATLAVGIISLGQAIIATGDNLLVYIALPISILSLLVAYLGADIGGVVGMSIGMVSALFISLIFHWKVYFKTIMGKIGNEPLLH